MLSSKKIIVLVGYLNLSVDVKFIKCHLLEKTIVYYDIGFETTMSS